MVVWTAQPSAESSSVANQPPCTEPMGFINCVPGVPWNTAKPGPTSTARKSSVLAMVA